MEGLVRRPERETLEILEKFPSISRKGTVKAEKSGSASLCCDTPIWNRGKP
jgi:hypothetical protein